MAAALFARDPLPTKMIRGFLGLPGELRNRIYTYYFEDEYRAEFAADNFVFEQRTFQPLNPSPDQSGPLQKYIYEPIQPLNPSPNLAAPCHKYIYEKEKLTATPKTIRISWRLGKYLRVDGCRTKWETSLCPLILVCKQVHYETIAFLYQDTTFVFQGTKRIINFGQTVPKRNLKRITKLRLHYKCYDEPALRGDLMFMHKHIATWNNACRALAKHLTALEHLEVWMHVEYMRHWSLRHEAIQPLFQFCRLTQKSRNPRSSSDVIKQGQTSESSSTIATPPPGGLKTVKVHFTTRDVFCGPWRHIWDVEYVIKNVHAGFGDAIAKVILGFSEKEAMKKFLEMWKEMWAEEQEWHPYLLHVTGENTEQAG